MFCEVYILDAPYHIDRAFDYVAPDGITCGAIVKVPFGKTNRHRLGVVTRLKTDTDAGANVKPVHSVMTDRPPFTDEMLGLCLFLKEHTLCTFGEGARTILPPGALEQNLNVKYSRVYGLALPRDDIRAALERTGREGIRSVGQRRILEYLLDGEVADDITLRALEDVTAANVKALVDKGLIAFSQNEIIRNPYEKYAKVADNSEIILSRAQTVAYSRIEQLYDEHKPRCALLYGVTGSGKTKVIMKTIDKVLSEGKSVIMLVPEIALTPQTVSIFCSRYGKSVAVIHSSLSRGERLDAYRRIRRADVNLVIGTRSAVFAPLDNLGMIVIDEEHEHTYKSESDPKYHAREVATFRVARNDALLLLASATPSVESFYKAKTGKYTLIPLTERYGGFRLPDTVIVDMREELRLGNVTPLSDRLYKSLKDVEENGNQAILFLNRRGYSSQINCKSCGEVITCPRCSVSLTFHNDRGGGRMLCHLCGYTEPVPRVCPSCSSDNLSRLGYGTQKVESALAEYLPDMTVMRMDADTTGAKLSYDRMIDGFRSRSADVLLGTQMVAKGHDFPAVTLVGVVLADTSLYLSDFRASERTFSLLTQVIGRAGRASDNGVAVIQTYSPKNEIIRLACKQDYDEFYDGEIAIRKELVYPPFCDMVQLTLTGTDEKEVQKEAQELSSTVISKLQNEYKDTPFTVFGPFEAQVYKLNDKYRMRMVMKCRLNKQTRAFFRELLCMFSVKRTVSLAIDLNPLTV